MDSGGTGLPTHMTDYATPVASVSAFCRAVLLRLIPNDLYGIGPEGAKNRDTIMKHVDTFVALRKFESLSLHEVAQGLKVVFIFFCIIIYDLPFCLILFCFLYREHIH